MERHYIGSVSSSDDDTLTAVKESLDTLVAFLENIRKESPEPFQVGASAIDSGIRLTKGDEVLELFGATVWFWPLPTVKIAALIGMSGSTLRKKLNDPEHPLVGTADNGTYYLRLVDVFRAFEWPLPPDIEEQIQASRKRKKKR